jgi:phospholipid/cholesterol/gamma-HCH transport system substrate-binding protein
MSPFRAGLIAVVVIAVGTYFAFSKAVPFRSHYEVSAVFRSANNVKERQPVRIAGVDVGQVVGIEHPEPGKAMAVIRMRIDDEGRPVHQDARVKIRPRLFLEGNWLIDLEPGTAGTKEIPDGGTIPIQQTSTPVQLGQVLTALQSDTRKNLQTVFDEYSSALEDEGADGFRRSIRHWKGAYRDSAVVQEATLGLGEHDLSGYIDGAGRVARGLDRSPEQLKNLVTDFDTAAGAFAREAGSLEAAIAELPRTLRAAHPALGELNRSFPSFRRFARDLRPSVRETGKTIPVSFPFLRQTRLLVSRAELRGLVRDLRPTVPSLARLTVRSRPLYEQLRLSASCENEVLHPWANDRLEDPNFPATGKVYEEAPKPLPGLAGESRSGDANGQWFRVLAAGGTNLVTLKPGVFGTTALPILGANPPRPKQRPPLRADQPCENQEPPDLRTQPGDPPPQKKVDTTSAAFQERLAQAREQAIRWLGNQIRVEGLENVLSVSEEDATAQLLDRLTGGTR